MKRSRKSIYLACATFILMSCSFSRVLSKAVEDPVPVLETPLTQSPAEAIEQPAPPTPPIELPLVHRIVYEKEGNIWSADPATNQLLQITFDGDSDGPAAGPKRYFSPLISPDGRYVAFTTATAFQIYSFADMAMVEIEKASSPDILADVVLGWDEGNKLYYTRTNGGCDLSTTPMKGPESVDVLRFDPATNASEKVSQLPKVDSASHAYSIGKSISPSGRFITAYNAACSVGLGSTFLWDTQDSTYALLPDGSAVLSPTENKIAYIDDTNLAMSGSTIITGTDRAMQNRETLYSPLMSGFLMTNPVWSPDDVWIAFEEHPIIDPELAESGGEYFIVDAYGPSYIVIVSQAESGQNELKGAMPEMFHVPGQGQRVGAWAPDGRAIVYTQQEADAGWNGPATLKIYDLATQSTLVVDQGVGVMNPDW